MKMELKMFPPFCFTLYRNDIFCHSIVVLFVRLWTELIFFLFSVVLFCFLRYETKLKMRSSRKLYCFRFAASCMELFSKTKWLRGTHTNLPTYLSLTTEMNHYAIFFFFWSFILTSGKIRFFLSSFLVLICT